MRLKKIMSLVLACAMALSLATVASAADTKVYFAEDFSGYEDISEFKSTITEISNKTNKEYAYAVSLPKKDGAENNFIFYTTNAGYFASNECGTEFTTNKFGTKNVKMFSPEYSNANTGNGNFFLIPDEAWDMGDHMDETFVVTYEYGANPAYLSTATSNWFETVAVWGSDYTVGDDGVKTWTSAPLQMQSFISTLGIGTTSSTETTDTAGADETVGTTTQTTVDPETCVATIVKTTVSEVLDSETGEATGEKTKTITTTVNTPADYVTLKASDHRWNQSGNSVNIQRGESYRIGLGFQADADNTDGTFYWPTKIVAIDGEKIYTNSTVHEYNSGIFGTNDKFIALALNNLVKYGLEYANFKMYSIKNDSFKAYIDNNEDVALNTKTIRVKFANPVSPATYTADTTAVVYADGVPMGEGTYSVGTLQNYIGDVGGEIYSYVDVTFDSLDEATTYTVEFPETITNEIGTTLAGKNVATFTTKIPDIKVNSFTVTNAAGLVADGSVQGAKVVLENTTSANKSVALIYAVYTTAGQLADVVYVNDTVAAEKTAEYEAGVKLNAAGTLKAFVWDGMTALKPYTGIQSAAITAVVE